MAWRSVAGRGVSVRVLRGVPEAFCSAGVLLGCGVLAQGVFGQFLWSAAPLRIRRAPAHGLVALAWLSVRYGGVCVPSSFSPPSSPYSGRQGLLLNSFSIKRIVQCDGCLIWGLGWRAGLVAGLRVGQAYGGVPPTWVWVVGVSPQILEHPTSICDTGVNRKIKVEIQPVKMPQQIVQKLMNEKVISRTLEKFHYFHKPLRERKNLLVNLVILRTTV